MTTTPAPLSDHPSALERLQACDYSQRWTLQELWDGARPSRPIRVIVDGVFDIFHLGHANLFRQIKADLLPPWCEVYTLALTPSDEDSTAYKTKPLQEQRTRQEMLRHCRYVDEVIAEFSWGPTPEICAQYKIDFVAHDAVPYLYGCGDDGDCFGWAKRAGMFLETKRTPGVSSTELRCLILEYEERSKSS